MALPCNVSVNSHSNCSPITTIVIPNFIHFLPTKPSAFPGKVEAIRQELSQYCKFRFPSCSRGSRKLFPDHGNWRAEWEWKMGHWGFTHPASQSLWIPRKTWSAAWRNVMGRWGEVETYSDNQARPLSFPNWHFLCCLLPAYPGTSSSQSWELGGLNHVTHEPGHPATIRGKKDKASKECMRKFRGRM